MSEFSMFLKMGGYGGFVWPCYILSGLVLGAIAVCSVRALRTAQMTLRTLESSERNPENSGNGST